MTREFIARKLLDAIWPPTCPICDHLTLSPDALCADCWSQLPVIGEPKCEFCGREVQGHIASICLECYEQPRAWDWGVSALNYSGIARLMVLRLKNMRAESLANIMAKIAWSECRDELAQVDVLVPIPLHWTRHLKRGFNQSALLGHELVQYGNYHMDETVLQRRKMTKPQVRLQDFEKRFANLESAFVLKNPSRIEGQRVMIVDDVMTSGASFQEAALCLRAANPKSISVFAFARAG